MSRHFPHEKLDVYRVTLEFVPLAHKLLGVWSSSWAVCNQFDRATESILINIAQAARFRGTPKGIFLLECCLGSVLECAACLDVAFLRHLVNNDTIHEAKQILQRIARMTVGLRAAWEGNVMEEGEPYQTTTRKYFLHENLDVYQRSLQLHAELDRIWCNNKIIKRYTKRIDELTTGLTLNIAEGNGRFSSLDHRKFIDIAKDAGTKLSVCLDIVEVSCPMHIGSARDSLRAVMAMLAGLSSHLQVAPNPNRSP
ncbi:MAG: four helix bundle protein [Lentisphaeria bacterium]|nr:four helix bundle protein [Lentisphaeria bacterium]